MDFFDRQADAQRRSVRLLLLFTIAVGAMLAALGLITVSVVMLCAPRGTPAPMLLGWEWRAVAWIDGLALFCIGCGAAIEWLNLGSGARLAERLGAENLAPDPGNFHDRQLRNVVEEMAIAASLPAPQIYVLRDEKAINALTVGCGAGNTVIILTAGALQRLSRDELQGVVAHEFGHLLNHDVDLNLRLVGLLSGVLFLAEIGLDILRAGETDRASGKEPNGLLVFAPVGVVFLAVGFLGYLAARVLQASLARERETLADAAAVQFTRNPRALAGALAKVAAAPGERLAGPAAAAKLGHLYFVEVNRRRLLDWFSTHPPLRSRIQLLVSEGIPLPAAVDDALARADLRETWQNLRADLGSYVDATGAPTPLHLSHARDLIAGLPPVVLAAVRDPCGGPAVALALLLSVDDAFRRRQRLLLVAEDEQPRAPKGTPVLPAVLLDCLDRIAEPVTQLSRGTRLALLNLALPTVHQLPSEIRAAFLAAANRLAAADGEIELFEYMLLQALQRALAPPAPLDLFPDGNRTDFLAFAPAVGVLLSTLSRAAADDAVGAENAFAAALVLLPALRFHIRLLPPNACGLDALSPALERLRKAAPGLRRVILAAGARAVSSDRRVELDEVELLRAVADALDCPIPPLVETNAEAG